MSVVLRAYGAEFDVDAYLKVCTLPVCSVARRGELVFTATQSAVRRHERSGVNVTVGDSDELPKLAAEAVSFLRSEFDQVKQLHAWPGVDGCELDFGIEWRDAAAHCDFLPSELIAVAGSLGLSIEISHYPYSRENADSELGELLGNEISPV